MSKIKCSHCGHQIDIDQALAHQIEEEVLLAERKKHQVELAKLRAEDEEKRKQDRKNFAEKAQQKIKAEQELFKQKVEQDLDLEREKLKIQFEGESKKRLQAQELMIAELKADAKADREAATNLQELVKDLRQELRDQKTAAQRAELEAEKKLAEEEDKIRQETRKLADEKHRLQILEMEKKLSDTQSALDAAQRKAAQGSQQNQGEVLELDLEQRLREEFPFDEITEVKKGQRGADVVQEVKNSSHRSCGIILYETKNGKWQPAWVGKFKDDIREAKANVGVIVSQNIPPEFGDLRQLEAGIWVAKPVLAPVLASALRTTILQVDTANRNNQNKDQKMEVLYQFLTGPEFRHRVEAIVDSYGAMQDEIEREKRAANLRWARQEKSIRAVIDNTLGMYGDLQGLTGGSLSNLPALEPGEDDISADNQAELEL